MYGWNRELPGSCRGGIYRRAGGQEKVFKKNRVAPDLLPSCDDNRRKE
jgi:hypothetical protein